MIGAAGWRARTIIAGLSPVLLAGLVVVVAPASGRSGGPSEVGAQPAANATTATTAAAAPATDADYGIIDAKGGVMTFGGAGYDGDTLGLTLAEPIVGGAADPQGGYWMVAADGGLFSFGAAGFFGSMGGQPLNKPIVGMAATPDGGGYWEVASDGGVFSFGDAAFFGSTGSLHLNRPIVGMASTPGGLGYWLVAADGGIFSYGDAAFFGSTGGLTLNKPMVGMAATADGDGYWLVASDGGIFTYGDAPFDGSTGSLALAKPIVGMARSPDGGGYWLVAADAGVFTFGDAQFSGSAQSPEYPPLYPAQISPPIAPEVAIINEPLGPEAAHQGGLRVVFSGDSLAWLEAYYVAQTVPGYGIVNGAASGCGFTNGAPLIPWGTATPRADPGACALWYEQEQWSVSHDHPDVTVIQTGYWESQDRLFAGSYRTLADPDYHAFILANLEQAVQIAHSDGGAVILSTSPYFANGTPNALVDLYNQMVRTVAATYPYVSVNDVFTELDPGGQYASTVDGVVARYSDGVHVTEAGVDSLIEPALNQIIADVAGPVYAANAS
jgi:hypothetical protein